MSLPPRRHDSQSLRVPDAHCPELHSEMFKGRLERAEKAHNSDKAITSAEPVCLWYACALRPWHVRGCTGQCTGGRTLTWHC